MRRIRQHTASEVMMSNWYDTYILPHFLHLACGSNPINKQRQKVVPHAQGRVLEIGMGSGLNIPHYQAKNVELVWGLEPNIAMREKARPRIEAAGVDIRWLDLPSENIPLDDNSADTIVLTYTLCTIDGWQAALAQMHRVLKPNGKLLFCEHGIAPDTNVAKWQNRLNRCWGKLAGGCHLNRDIPEFITTGGFNIQHMDADYIPSTPKFAGYNYWGYATKT